MWAVPGTLGSSTTCMEPRAVGPAVASVRPPASNSRPKGPSTVSRAVRSPALSETRPSTDSTATSELVACSWKSGSGGVVRTRREARTATTSCAGDDRSTVTVGVLRCEPRCSTGLLRTATDTVESEVSTEKASLA